MSTVIELMDSVGTISDEVVYRDIRKDDFWGPEVLEEYRQPGETRKQLILRWIERQREGFFEAISEAAEEGDAVVVYRCLSVRDPQKFLFMIQRGIISPQFKGLGIFWSWDLEAAECHWSGGGGTDIYVKGIVPFSAINVKDTFLSNMQPSTGEVEKEIRLRHGAAVGVIDMAWRDEEGNFRWAENGNGVMAMVPA